MIYDMIILTVSVFFVLVLHPSSTEPFSSQTIIIDTILGAVCLLVWRFVFRVYKQIWRYGGHMPFIRLMVADGFATVTYLLTGYLLPLSGITAIRQVTVMAIQLLLCISIRLLYQYFFQKARLGGRFHEISTFMLKVFGGIDVKEENIREQKVNIAILGAGQVGVKLAEELLVNPYSMYCPVLFLDTNARKIGFQLAGIPVIAETDECFEKLTEYGVRQVVIAVPKMSIEEKITLYEKFQSHGFAVKLYDFPATQSMNRGARRELRNFDIEELLFRNETEFDYEKIRPAYTGKTVLISGGGGSIGSELARQIAKMSPKRIVLLDIYENGAYDLSQELNRTYAGDPEICVEIGSVCDRKETEKVFRHYRPEIVIHAAAHKHVPLMESKCCEAIKNNIFGTKNMVDCAMQYGAERFLMVSTDKAVNPTNVMGATKRVCERIVQDASTKTENTVFCATRFGNVLGSSGSVVPLFKKQIEQGGPVTITDKRIIRYFMTIPEAAYLVLCAGAQAGNGELYVLDMGDPVRILDLAETMIRLSGFVPYTEIQIVETGLRPGEKLYEELLVRDETVKKTENEKLFIETGEAPEEGKLAAALEELGRAAESGDDDLAKKTLHRLVPAYKEPEVVNEAAEQSREMQRSGRSTEGQR